jgi:hypothetical protein
MGLEASIRESSRAVIFRIRAAGEMFIKAPHVLTHLADKKE